jgi:hypothetical protein
VAKGNQLWCAKDNLSYQGLALRWAKNQTIKSWWASLTDVQQAEWFKKWASLSSKRRFDEMFYQEISRHALQMLEDEVDDYQTWIVFKRNRIGTMSEAAITQEWEDIIKNNQTECLWKRNQWLVPEFQGVIRKKRKLDEQAWETGRTANVSSEAALGSLVAGGEQMLARFGESIAAPLISKPQEPEVDARPEDMPRAAKPDDAMLGCIRREVRLGK